MEWAGVVGRPSEFTREWAYTALSRARGPTNIYVIAEATFLQRKDEAYASSEPERTAVEALDSTIAAMRSREAEALAINSIMPAELPPLDRIPSPCLPLAEVGEAAREHASAVWDLRSPPSQLGWGDHHQQREDADRSRGLER